MKNGRFHFVSSMHLLHCYMYEEGMVAKTFLFAVFGIKNGAYHFFNKSFRELVVVRLCVFLRRPAQHEVITLEN